MTNHDYTRMDQFQEALRVPKEAEGVQEENRQNGAEILHGLTGFKKQKS
jgi:hypothetical protein